MSDYNAIAKALLIAAGDMADKVAADEPEFADLKITASYPRDPYNRDGVHQPRAHRWEMRIVADELKYERWTTENRL